MLPFDITYQVCDFPDNPKRLTAAIVAPDGPGPDTGAMLFTHGWGGNRFRVLDLMQYATNALDVVCISVEYRQSGYDCDPVDGDGWDRPYDASFYQVFDVLNGLRTVLSLYARIDRSRLFHYGCSQGGHIALLSSIFAPRTFASIYASSPITHLAETYQQWAGRAFAAFELAARNVVSQAEHIRCPVFIDHGTADEVVPCDEHSRPLAQKLQALGKPVTATWHEGAGHQLEPQTSRLEVFKAAAEPIGALRNEYEDDFQRGDVIQLSCGNRTLRIDWSQAVDSVELVRWMG